MHRYPLLLQPVFKDYIWGGTLLRDDFGKQSDFERIAESWELSCHKDGENIITNGKYAKTTLSEYIKNNPKAMGLAYNRFEDFPILIKLIDAHDRLSVQVHPNNEYALRNEQEYGKTEMWYIVDCDEGAELLYGFKHEISREEFSRRIAENSLLDVVRSVPVKKGDVFFIEAGTLHAIGKGILIAEIQQNSNTTYRIYDYGRLGTDGNPRPLHIEKAVEVTNLTPAPPQKIYPEEDGSRLLAKCDYFTVSITKCEETVSFYSSDDSFTHILVLEGDAELCSDFGKVSISKGTSVLIPASLGKITIKGSCEYISTKI